MERSFGLYLKANRVLAVLVIVFGLYIALGPLLPEITFRVSHSAWWRAMTRASLPSASVKPFVTPRVSMAAETSPTSVVVPIPEQNTLLIPEIDVHTQIVEGDTSKALETGIWHRPKTSTPDKGGNTVLVGHRFLYTAGPHTFYHLDKLKVGDRIVLYWQKKRYEYVVDSILVTSPLATEIEQQTSQPILTLYTCTPLFTVDKRLVVRAHLAADSL
jgi:LPXTG-site transpeptidase (sortase) family protein